MSTETPGNEKINIIPKRYYFYLFGGILFFWVVSGFSLYFLEDRGTFGDMFGAVNALFSGLALAGVILAILLQGKQIQLQSDELKLQVKELEETKREIAGQRRAIEKQNVSMEFQQFENNFFNLLKMHHNLTNSIRVGTFEGRQGFGLIAYELGVLYKIFASDSISPASAESDLMVKYDMSTSAWLEERDNIGDDDEKCVKVSYKWLFDMYHFELGHYYRNIYHILKLIDNRFKLVVERLQYEQLSADEYVLREERTFKKYKRYSDLVQAQMSSAELAMLFYNALFFSEMKNLIERYDFLENLTVEDLLLEQHKNHYEIEFKSREDLFD